MAASPVAQMRFQVQPDCAKCVIAQKAAAAQADDRRTADAAADIALCKRAVFLRCRPVLISGDRSDQAQADGPPSSPVPVLVGADRHAPGLYQAAHSSPCLVSHAALTRLTRQIAATGAPSGQARPR